MKLDYWNPCSVVGKQNHVIAKLAVSIFLMEKVESVVPAAPTPVGSEIFEVSDQSAQKEKCDIFSGDWIPNPSGPIYTNESCHDIQDFQNCIRNGRPDADYLYWRWKPQDCELPRFNAERFLKAMRNKSWAFIGDSISRNHVQSLLCILSKVADAIEVYHDKEYRSKRWHFPKYNFTLSVIWSPFLVKAAIFEEANGVSSSEIQLHLDEVDEIWTKQYHNFDYVVIAGGKWFLKTAIYYENKTITGCHYCSGKNLTEFGVDYAYRKALQQVLNFITLSDHDATILFRTATPDHFENGEWFSGGTCKRRVPFKEGEIDLNDLDSMMRDIELEEFEKAAEVGSQRGLTLKLLDTSRMSLLRPDGHPGPYRQLHPFAKDQNAKVQYDCLHWCLPGPIDSWNDLLMQIVVNL
ncbi:trichome birefringence-like [Thalictrum thalictroides]|uniref:Trichome birefringence-like n=1 Tax=Thalictrum thalictroides TaxID=46969 RepID=A0A7J6VY95_THATH|nr:trichome birefringence-like [Thalictrum thalictroides]